MSYSDAMLAYTTVLYLAFFGMVAFDAQALVTKRSKQLGGLVFLVMLVETARQSG